MIANLYKLAAMGGGIVLYDYCIHLTSRYPEHSIAYHNHHPAFPLCLAASLFPACPLTTGVMNNTVSDSLYLCVRWSIFNCLLKGDTPSHCHSAFTSSLYPAGAGQNTYSLYWSARILSYLTLPCATIHASIDCHQSPIIIENTDRTHYSSYDSRKRLPGVIYCFRFSFWLHTVWEYDNMAT